MGYAEHPLKQKVGERIQYVLDHSVNIAHGSTISAASATITDDYQGASVSSCILSSITRTGLRAAVLVGDFPKPGQYTLSMTCTIGTETFIDDLVITVYE